MKRLLSSVLLICAAAFSGPAMACSDIDSAGLRYFSARPPERHGETPMHTCIDTVMLTKENMLAA